MHQDVNPANIVLAQEHATLVDFQTAVNLSHASGVTGTAPIKPLTCGKPPATTPKQMSVRWEKYFRGCSSETPCSAVGLELVGWCLRDRSERRCSTEEASRRFYG